MLHASVRAVGRLVGGPDEIHLAVADAIAPGGTVMMYAGCQDGFDDVGRGVLSPEEESAILAHQPAFDFRHARAARDFGILAEFFRSYPGAICSEAVCARMAARGPQAEWLLADPPWNYGFGHGSPLDKLCASGGKDGTTMLWDLNESKHLYSLNAGDEIHALVFSPNRYWLCAATSSSIIIFDLEKKSKVDELKPEFQAVGKKSREPECVSLAWSGDGQTLFAGYTDNIIRAWGVMSRA